MSRYRDIIGDFYNEREILEYISTYYDFSADAYAIIAKDLYDDVEWANFIFEISPEYKKDKYSAAIFGDYGLGRVTLYLYSILKETPKRYICTMIVSVLVHELKHAGQKWLVDNEYESDQAYINTVERPVEWETLQYLIEKREYLEDRLGVCIDVSAFKKYHIKYPVYNTNSYIPMEPDGYWLMLLKELYCDNQDIMQKVINTIANESTVALQLVFSEDNENKMFYTYAQYIKRNGIITYPDIEMLDLINSLSVVKNYRYTFKVGVINDGVRLIRSTYDILENPPLIKYDKPCTT